MIQFHTAQDFHNTGTLSYLCMGYNKVRFLITRKMCVEVDL